MGRGFVAAVSVFSVFAAFLSGAVLSCFVGFPVVPSGIFASLSLVAWLLASSVRPSIASAALPALDPASSGSPPSRP